MRAAMDVMGISKQESGAIFQTLAALLRLGNAKFQEKSGSDEAEMIVDENTCIACELLGISPEALAYALTGKEITAGMERYRKTFNVQQVSALRLL